MGCGIEPRKIRHCRGRGFLFARRQHVQHRYARCCRPAGVEGHITCKRIASEAGRSRARPRCAEYGGPHREGEEPKPMMHGHEKSDPVIVAMKPANKAVRSATEPSVKEPAAAESVERRVGTKGNADRQSTRRTQSRASVSQALERIRQMGSRMLCRLYPRWEPYAESRTYGSVRGACDEKH